MYSFGFLVVMLFLYLEEIGYSPTDVGILFTGTLLGDAPISLIMTSHADKWGRRITLLIGSILSIGTSIVFAVQTNFYVTLVVSIVGVISPSGNEVGPFMAIELSAISQISPDKDRTKIMAWYNLFGCFANALGCLSCGCLLAGLMSSSTFSLSLLQACRVALCFCSLLLVLKSYFFYQLSPAIEVSVNEATVKNNNPVSLFVGLHKSQRIVMQLGLLFVIDSFAGSLILQTIISNWFHQQYGTPPELIGSVMFICNLVAGVSALFAAKLADSIGLVMTMVVTHLPSNVLVILMPLMPTESTALLLLCARYCISQMDVPTRNAYVQGVVEPDERSAANGILNVVRSIGASTGPYLAGLLYAQPKYVNVPFFIAGGLKILYDLLLLYSFHAVKRSPERPSVDATHSTDSAEPIGRAIEMTPSDKDANQRRP